MHNEAGTCAEILPRFAESTFVYIYCCVKKPIRGCDNLLIFNCRTLFANVWVNVTKE